MAPNNPADGLYYLKRAYFNTALKIVSSCYKLQQLMD